MPDVLFLLLLGHIFGDYALQTDYMAKQKGKSLGVLSLHVLVYTLCIGVFWWLGKSLNGDLEFPKLVHVLVLLGLYVEHWLQDLFKSTRLNGSKQGFFIDQALHLGVLYVMRIFF